MSGRSRSRPEHPTPRERSGRVFNNTGWRQLKLVCAVVPGKGEDGAQILKFEPISLTPDMSSNLNNKPQDRARLRGSSTSQQLPPLSFPLASIIQNLIQTLITSAEFGEKEKMGKIPVRMKLVTYALSPFQQKVMPGLWKDLSGKISHKISENWISTTLLLGPLVGTYS
ncbi:hypothetical protein SASPL_120245 [Salvia splendens]|uniref:Uncharacterized protein n=1 Tax=Salvia splendens TaxID=180675 RepID=A0A8X8ZV19_SALSN|nr:hypothetical protein SASPL_120245 [Salvia splendens]